MSNSKEPNPTTEDDNATPEVEVETPENTNADVTPDSDEVTEDALEAAGEPESESDSEDESASAEETPEADDAALSDEVVDAEIVAETEEVAETTEPVSVEPAPVAPPEKIIERKGSVMPGLLGGVIAAAVGFGAARYDSGDWPFASQDNDTFRQDTQTAFREQADTLETLQSQLGTAVAETGETISGLRNDLASTSAALDETRQSVESVVERVGSLESLPDQFTSLEAQISDLAKRPIEDNVSREAIKAYEDELERLRASMEEQRKAIEETIAAEKAKMQKIAEEATQMEERAIAEARVAAARSAMTRILSALDTGDAFAAALGELGANIDQPIPDALSAVADNGVSTLASLREQFPDLARAALRSERSASTDEASGGGIGSVLEKMFEVRSTAPREGDDADAVLSRAESAVRDGDISKALDELSGLGEAPRAELENWIADAEARLQAITAAQDIAQQLNQV